MTAAFSPRLLANCLTNFFQRLFITFLFKAVLIHRVYTLYSITLRWSLFTLNDISRQCFLEGIAERLVVWCKWSISRPATGHRIYWCFFQLLSFARRCSSVGLESFPRLASVFFSCTRLLSCRIRQCVRPAHASGARVGRVRHRCFELLSKSERVARESSTRGARGGQSRRARLVSRGRAPAPERLALGLRFRLRRRGARARALRCALAARRAPSARARNCCWREENGAGAESEAARNGGARATCSRRTRADLWRSPARAAHAAVASSGTQLSLLYVLPCILSSLVYLYVYCYYYLLNMFLLYSLGWVAASFARVNVPRRAARSPASIAEAARSAVLRTHRRTAALVRLSDEQRTPEDVGTRAEDQSARPSHCCVGSRPETTLAESCRGSHCWRERRRRRWTASRSRWAFSDSGTVWP